MIADRHEFEITLRQLQSVESALDLLEEELSEAGPGLRAAAPAAYERRIADLQAEIAAYLNNHPADLSLLTRHTESSLAPTV